METVKDIASWLATLKPENSVGIDDGGLCLREVDCEGFPTEAYYEIGGIPIEQEPELTAEQRARLQAKVKEVYGKETAL